MHITILTTGSRGDIQPYLALGMGLRQAGHCVQVQPICRLRPWFAITGYVTTLKFHWIIFNEKPEIGTI